MDTHDTSSYSPYHGHKEFNTIKYIIYIWCYKIKYDYFMTNKLYEHLEDYVSQNIIPNLQPTSKDWHHFMITEVDTDLT